MTNPFEHTPEVTPLPIAPEIEHEEKRVPIEVIEGALEHMNDEDEDVLENEGDIEKPTIH